MLAMEEKNRTPCFASPVQPCQMSHLSRERGLRFPKESKSRAPLRRCRFRAEAGYD